MKSSKDVESDPLNDIGKDSNATEGTTLNASAVVTSVEFQWKHSQRG